jgi:mono/diheme cytochrome c family protein
MLSQLITRACVGLLVLTGGQAFGAPEPSAVFIKKCSGCHTFGHGDRVGPDLKGVTERRTRPWLRSWIRSSDRMLQARDRTALTLFERFKRERMPDQKLSTEEIDALLDFFAAGGPLTTAAARPRHAATASAADVALGRELFLGATRPRSGGAPCGSCHSVRIDGAASGGTFAGDLTHVYSRFQDPALSAFLKRPCSPRAFTVDDGTQLTDAEAFAVKAFLRDVDARASHAGGRGGGGR